MNTPDPMPVIGAIGAKNLANWFGGLLEGTDELSADARKALDGAVADFVARSPLLLAVVLRRKDVLDNSPEIAEQLVRQALALAENPTAKRQVERVARSAGFGKIVEEAPTAHFSSVFTRVIPDELLNRFSPRWVVLPPYSETDFADIAAQMKLAPGVLDPAKAAASNLNFRAVEAAITEDALRARDDEEF